MTNAGDLPKPLGFPNCVRCAYRTTGSPSLCAECAAKSLRPLADDHCNICSQTLDGPDARCRNKICGWDARRRCFTKVDALALYSGSLETTIKRFKYDGRAGWALIFGRLIVGWLEAHADEVADIELIIGNPTSPKREPFQHIEAIMRAAATEDVTGRWPFDNPDRPVLVKRTETEKSAKGGTWNAKMQAAQEHAAALSLVGDVAGKRILLIDDVFTTGSQFHTVSKMLREAGMAKEVRGLALARVSWDRR